MIMIDVVRNHLDWIRGLKPGDVSKATFKKYHTLKSISVQLADYNAGRGKERGVFVHAKYNKSELSITLVAVSLKEREMELSDPEMRNEWRKLIVE